MEQIIKDLKTHPTFYDFLVYIRDTEGLMMVNDNGWYWLEYYGEEVEGSAKERFTKQSEINDLMRLAGISSRISDKDVSRRELGNHLAEVIQDCRERIKMEDVNSQGWIWLASKKTLAEDILIKFT
tara:strand:- start:16126 stop:16503 length:378 start_codon:yes stop_codon:yes gene_type:complete